MNETTPPELYALARASYTKALEHIPENYRQSLPVPILKNKNVYITFLYYKSTIRYKMPTIIFAPSWVQNVDCESGEIIDWRRISPGEFGRGIPEGQVGELSLPPNMTADQFKAAEQQLYNIMEQLMPSFQRWEAKSSIEKENALRLAELFDKIVEPPLRLYYEAIGYNFLHWLKH